MHVHARLHDGAYSRVAQAEACGDTAADGATSKRVEHSTARRTPPLENKLAEHWAEDRRATSRVPAETLVAEQVVSTPDF